MPSSDQTNQRGLASGQETSAGRGASGEGDVASPAGSTGSTRSGLLFLALGLLGGIAGGMAVEQTHDFFKPAKVEGAAGNGILTAEQLAHVTAAQLGADYRNVPLAMGLLGLVAGACLGLAPGAARRSAILRLCVGGLAGAALGAVGGLAAVFVREQLRGWDTLDKTGQPDALLVQLHTMAVQLPTWIGIAISVGLTAGVLGRSGALVGRTAGLAIVAVVLASLLYPTLVSIFFATQDPGGVIPGGMASRLFWGALHAGLLGLIIGGVASPARLPSAPAASAGSM